MRLFLIGFLTLTSVVLVSCYQKLLNMNALAHHYPVYGYGYNSYGGVPARANSGGEGFTGAFGGIFELIIFIVVFMLIINLLTSSLGDMTIGGSHGRYNSYNSHSGGSSYGGNTGRLSYGHSNTGHAVSY